MGSGKTTLARSIAHQTGIAYAALDELYWSEGWRPAPEAEYRHSVEKIAREESWVADTFSSGATASALVRCATVVIWLDLPRALCAWRVLRRTITNIVRRNELWHGNRDSWKRLLSTRSPVLTSLRTHRDHRTRIDDLVATIDTSRCEVLHFGRRDAPRRARRSDGMEE
ncbi:hypothetical protein [Luteimicrobium sp. DT211]|uniref:hypothetical protein n=1 Tax=Luteimicrobium sp. DT211 TaxID=3393412 RepID=UPI003CF66251